ncbi:hypothetical protein [Streptomyces sp. NPDC002490]|uniref:hypothetical protein n=1 Tax=Streptomyces sp. NPDC002490 TaxID=3154416 RepID=UPI00332B14AE
MTIDHEIADDTTAVPAEDDRPPARERRAALIRWAAAALVFAAAATGSGFALLGADRTDLPGLATAADGRWEYPTIRRPALPEGAPGPFAETNPAAVHHAALRKLLLPAPRGSAPDPTLRSRDGWVSPGDFARLFARSEVRDAVPRHLADYAVRRIAARGWTTPDGTRTQVHLLRFGSAGAAESWRLEHGWRNTGPHHLLRGVAAVQQEEFPKTARSENVAAHLFTEVEPHGREHTRFAFLEAGDVVALVVQSRAGGVRDVPFLQTVTLQSQLLG